MAILKQVHQGQAVGYNYHVENTIRNKANETGTLGVRPVQRGGGDKDNDVVEVRLDDLALVDMLPAMTTVDFASIPIVDSSAGKTVFVVDTMITRYNFSYGVLLEDLVKGRTAKCRVRGLCKVPLLSGSGSYAYPAEDGSGWILVSAIDYGVVPVLKKTVGYAWVILGYGLPMYNAPRTSQGHEFDLRYVIVNDVKKIQVYDSSDEQSEYCGTCIAGNVRKNVLVTNLDIPDSRKYILVYFAYDIYNKQFLASVGWNGNNPYASNLYRYVQWNIGEYRSDGTIISTHTGNSLSVTDRWVP